MESDTAEKQGGSVEGQQATRRTFLSYVIVAIGGFISTTLGIPLVGSAVLPALRAREANWIPVGPVADFPIGQPKPANVSVTQRDGWIEQTESKGVWVVRNGENSFTVFNGRCVHLGCAFNWQEAQKEFLCPCHGGRYSIDGKVIGGPPPRPLDTLEWRVEQGNLVVRYQDFRLGVPQKEVA
ncbi:MAG: ubiquinol-cytochrome c reductase iron-sulfur subunit [Sphingomonadaceae bacterium]